MQAVTVIWDPVHQQFLAHDVTTDRWALLVPVAWVDGRPVQFERVSQYQPAKAEA